MATGYPWATERGNQAITADHQYLNVKQKVPTPFCFFRLGDFTNVLRGRRGRGTHPRYPTDFAIEGRGAAMRCAVSFGRTVHREAAQGWAKVAICEQSAPELPAAGSSGKGDVFQLSAPADKRGAGGRGLMPRQMVRVITPGTVGRGDGAGRRREEFSAGCGADGEGFALAAIDVRPESSSRHESAHGRPARGDRADRAARNGDPPRQR